MNLNRKNKSFVFCFLFLLYLTYEFGISNTVHYYNEFSKLESKQKSNLYTKKNEDDLFLKEKQLSSILSRFDFITGNNYQNVLLSFINSNNSGINIIEFNEPHTFIENNIKTTTYNFRLQGSFNSILKLINNIENHPEFGNVILVNFYKNKNLVNNNDELIVDVILKK